MNPELTENTKCSAVVIGSNGGLGAAFSQHLTGKNDLGSKYEQVLSISRKPTNGHSQTIDFTDESTISSSAIWLAEKCKNAPLRLIVVATGYLHTDGSGPERSFQQLDSDYLQRVMLINTIGPALILKHFAPLVPKTGEVRLAFISAKVGSIGDNALGGWYGYRASKAALNQIVKTASIELTRRNKQSVCISLHPGTIATTLSNPFSKTGLNVRSPEVASEELLKVIEQLTPAQTGGFYDYAGKALPW